MELTRARVILFAVLGIIVCLVAMVLLSGHDKAGQEEDNILGSTPVPGQYEGSAPNGDGKLSSPTAASRASGRPGAAQWDDAAGLPEDERQTGAIPEVGMLSDDEFDLIEQEILQENQRYARRQKAIEDSICQKNVEDGVQELTERSKPKESRKSRKKKEQNPAPSQQAQTQSGRFSSVAIRKQAKTNAIKAFVHSQQVVRQGSTLKMRVAEDCLTDDGQLLPKNSFVYGLVKKIDGERVDVEISSVNVEGNILPFNKIVYSSDAQRGIRVTNTAKSEAAKEATSDAVDGTNINMSSGSSGILGAGMGLIQGAVQGTKRAVSKNVKDVKVTIKTNYELLFMEPDDNDVSGDDDY